MHCAAAPPPGGADHDLVETVHDSVDPAETEHNSSETAHAPSETGDATPADPSKIPPPHEEDEGVHRVFTENYAATQPELSKKAFKNRQALWPKAAVIYRIDPSVGCPFSKMCKLLMSAMTHYEERTCVRFKERSGESDYVDIFVNQQNRAACYSTLGRIGGIQKMSLGKDCWLEGIVIHEMGHALSFTDEQNRPDRDNWLWIFWENIMPNMYHAFTKASPYTTNLLEEPLDFNSIMMYDEYGFSKDGRSQTLRAKNNVHLKPIWLKNGLSSLDIKKINKLYRCKGANQKPRFPVDINCTFDDNFCGFKGIDGTKDGRWQWVAKPSGLYSYISSDGGYLFTDYGSAENHDLRTWSVNFHGLSPLDEERGPKGCLSFSYAISTDGKATLKFMQTSVDSPYARLYEPKEAKELWSTSDPTGNQWYKTLIPIDVTKPFMIDISSQYGEGTTEGSVKVDDLEVKYTPCTTTRKNEPPKPRLTPSPSTSSPSRRRAAPARPLSLLQTFSSFWFG